MCDYHAEHTGGLTSCCDGANHHIAKLRRVWQPLLISCASVTQAVIPCLLAWLRA